MGATASAGRLPKVHTGTVRNTYESKRSAHLVTMTPQPTGRSALHICDSISKQIRMIARLLPTDPVNAGTHHLELEGSKPKGSQAQIRNMGCLDRGSSLPSPLVDDAVVVVITCLPWMRIFRS